MVTKAVTLLAAVVPFVAAWDAEFPVWCNEEFQGPQCFQRLSDKCYDCLHPGEAACPGSDKEFLDCFCPIPSSSWSTIEKCLNDPASTCNDQGLDLKLILNNFGTQCSEYNHQLCAAGAKLDDIEVALVSVSCSDTVPSATGEPVTTPSKPAVTTPTAQATTPAVQDTTTKHAGPTATGAPTTQAAATTTPPVVVSGGGAVRLGGAGALAMAAAGVGAFAVGL